MKKKEQDPSDVVLRGDEQSSSAIWQTHYFEEIMLKIVISVSPLLQQYSCVTSHVRCARPSITHSGHIDDK
jgi:hypothetical protein